MKNFRLFSLLALLIVFYSCIEDDLTGYKFSNSKNIELNKINIVEGRLYFPNLETFQAYYHDMREINEDKVADIFDSKFYQNGFYSLVPIVNERTERFQAERHLSILKERSSILSKTTPSDADIIEHFDDLEK